MSDPVQEFRGVLAQAGLIVGEIIADGDIHRCGTVGKEQGSDGAYLLHMDSNPAGWYRNFRTGDSGTWKYSNGSGAQQGQGRTPIRQSKHKSSGKEEQKARIRKEARRKADYIMSNNPPASRNNPYLIKKGVLPYGEIRTGEDDRLILPVNDVSGQIVGLQYIFSNGKKIFLEGTSVKESFFVIPSSKKDIDCLYIAEGYATGASVHSATNATVLVAFNSENIISVAQIAREKYPERTIVVCADDDRDVEGNPGISKATEAAKAIMAKLAVPSFKEPTAKTDFNDLHLAEGLEAVKSCLAKATIPKQDVAEAETPNPIPFFELPPPIEPSVVPEPLQTLCLEVANSIQVPFELSLANALGGLAVAVQRKIKVLVCPGYTEPLCIYILCPLPPGERKSSTVKEFKRPLLEWQITQGRELAEAIRAVESERKTREKVIEQKRNAAGKIKCPEGLQNAIKEISEMEKAIPTLPVAPRLLADDFTPEALPPLLERHEQRIGVLEAEGGLFDILAGLYSKGVPNLDAVLKCWSGEACQIDRKSQAPIFLDDPHLTMVISPQPEVVLGLTRKPGFRGRGLLGRFLFLWPKSLLGRRVVQPKPLPQHVSEAWRAIIHRLLNLPWAKDEHGELGPYHVELTADALGLWRECAQAVEKELRPGGAYEYMTDWAGKYPGQAIRLAGLLHAATVEEPQASPISPETMNSALNIARVFAEHSKAAYGMMGSDPSQECAQAILRWILLDRCEQFTARDALRAVRGRYKTMAKVNPGLAILEERAYIFQQDQSEPKGPGRKPSPTYVVNPKVWGAGR